jgi:hypothetical protein
MDPIAEIGASNPNMSSVQRYEQCQNTEGAGNIQACGNGLGGAHLERIVIVGHPAPVAMNLVSTGAMFSDRIKGGFYTKQLDEMVAKLNDPRVSPGEQQAAVLDVEERIGTARIVSQISQKLAEGLQSVVTKSG